MIVKDTLHDMACFVFQGVRGLLGDTGPSGDPGPRGPVVSEVGFFALHRVHLAL